MIAKVVPRQRVLVPVAKSQLSKHVGETFREGKDLQDMQRAVAVLQLVVSAKFKGVATWTVSLNLINIGNCKDLSCFRSLSKCLC